MIKYSIIVPVYNRPEEMKEFLDSLVIQNRPDLEVIVVEDGSTQACDFLIDQYDLKINYYFKKNSGPGDSRNFGMEKATGQYLLFFDSDCVLPEEYFTKLDEGIDRNQPDAFGGPDAAHESFSDIQKAINYAMTSFLTTGGIRGGKKQLDRYQPRSFNMGFSEEVYQNVGGFSDIHPGEDPDLSFRIMEAGFKVTLIPEAKVYHKRRIDFRKFSQQVYKFGVVRVILNKWYPKTQKTVYFFPSLFLIGVLLMVGGALFYDLRFIIPLVIYSTLLWIDAFVKTASIKIALLSLPAAGIQLCAYGFGFLQSFGLIKLLRREERKVFPTFFFKR